MPATQTTEVFSKKSVNNSPQHALIWATSIKDAKKDECFLKAIDFFGKKYYLPHVVDEERIGSPYFTIMPKDRSQFGFQVDFVDRNTGNTQGFSLPSKVYILGEKDPLTNVIITDDTSSFQKALKANQAKEIIQQKINDLTIDTPLDVFIAINDAIEGLKVKFRL